MTSFNASQQSPPKNQTSSPSTAATNTSNAANAQESTVPPTVNHFRDLSLPLWKNEGDSGKGPVLGGIHSSAPPSQHQDQTRPEAARTTDNDDSNGTAGKLPQSFDSTAQHLADIEPSTSRSMTAAEHGEGFVRPETSGSGFPDPTDTDTNSLPQGRVNSREPSSRTLTANGDEAIVEQAMRESFEVITEGPFSDEQKRDLLLNAASKLQSRTQRYPGIATILSRVTSSMEGTSTRNLWKKIPNMAKTLSDINEHTTRHFGPGEAPTRAYESRKTKTSSALDTEEQEQPSTRSCKGQEKKRTRESDSQEDGPPAKKEKHRHAKTYAGQIMIINDRFGFASDLQRYATNFYRDALVVSTDGSFGSLPESRHAGAGAAWQARETRSGDSKPGEMKWQGAWWPLGRAVNDRADLSKYAELMAIKLALQMIAGRNLMQGKQKLVIQSDSKSCLLQIRDRLDGKGPRDGDVQGVLECIDALVSSGVDVKLIWVKGHDLCTGNHIADKLANRGRVHSELGTPPVTSLDDSAPQGEVRTYAAGLTCKVWKKATCDAGTQTEPLMDEDQGATTEAVHVLEESPKSATTPDASLPYARPYTTETSTSTAAVASLPNEARGTTKAQGATLSTAKQTKLQNRVGATTQFAHFSMASSVAEPLASSEDLVEKNGNGDLKRNHELAQKEDWAFDEFV
ncbi:hypothetical protein NU195Hw_g1363t1 [Hortaea werneckii]